MDGDENEYYFNVELPEIVKDDFSFWLNVSMSISQTCWFTFSRNYDTLNLFK